MHAPGSDETLVALCLEGNICEKQSSLRYLSCNRRRLRIVYYDKSTG
jgi:hypothetical protein